MTGVAATDCNRLLTRARNILTGVIAVPGGNAARSAAWMGRAALEAGVLDVLRRHHIAAKDASMRSQLACLVVLEPSLAADARAAWSGLSRSSHHHAFAFSPGTTEVHEFLDMTGRVADASLLIVEP